MANMIISTSLSRGNDAGYIQKTLLIYFIFHHLFPALCITVYMLITAESYYRILHIIRYTSYFFYPNILIFNLLALLKLQCLNLNKMCIVLAFLEFGWYEHEL
jgi:hypothetical protein